MGVAGAGWAGTLGAGVGVGVGVGVFLGAVGCWLSFSFCPGGFVIPCQIYDKWGHVFGGCVGIHFL